MSSVVQYCHLSVRSVQQPDRLEDNHRRRHIGRVAWLSECGHSRHEQVHSLFWISLYTKLLQRPLPAHNEHAGDAVHEQDARQRQKQSTTLYALSLPTMKHFSACDNLFMVTMCSVVHCRSTLCRIRAYIMVMNRSHSIHWRKAVDASQESLYTQWAVGVASSTGRCCEARIGNELMTEFG